jgi:hypothetical protein
MHEGETTTVRCLIPDNKRSGLGNPYAADTELYIGERRNPKTGEILGDRVEFVSTDQALKFIAESKHAEHAHDITCVAHAHGEHGLRWAHRRSWF